MVLQFSRDVVNPANCEGGEVVGKTRPQIYDVYIAS